MSFIKKLSIGFGVCVTMMVAFIIGLNLPKNEVKGGGTNNVPPKDEVVKVDKPKYHTYKAEDIVLQAGGDTIDYSYVPDTNATTAPITTYEYKFGNPMSVKMAVYLKSIDVTGVTVGFAYKDSAWDRVSDLDVSEYYTTQSIEVGDNVCKYIYITVTPDDANVPVGFNTSIKWNLGVAETMTVGSNINNTPVTKTIVAGQEIEQSTYAELANENLPDGYYFDAWFLDEDFTKLATFPLTSYGQPLYARYANLPQNVTTYTTYSDGSYTLTADPNIADLIIPTYYNDGTNGEASITSIGAGSTIFNETSVLTTISLPLTTINIGDSAFAWTGGAGGNAINVNISSCINLSSIGKNAFSNNGLSSIDFTNCKNLTSIGNLAFDSTSLQSIDLSQCEKLTTLGTSLFSYCSGLVSVKLPQHLTTIGDGTFYYCEGLITIDLPSSLTTLGANAFYECTSLETISIPSGVTSIPANAFYYCSALTSIDLSACTSLASIGDSAFRGCSALKQITIPKNVTSIGANAFDSCLSLTSVILPKELTILGAYAFNNCSVLENINLGDTKIDSVGNRAFYQCKNLSSAYIPSTVTSVGYDAFHYCSSLTSIVVGSGNTVYDSRNNCNALIETATNTLIQGCNTTVIPTTVTSIGDWAFYHCSSLTSIDFSNCTSLISIGNFAFEGCSKLTSMDLSGCTSLKSIGDDAFYNCSGLTSITISASVTKIGWIAFARCNKLTSITFEDTSVWYYTASRSYTSGTQIDVTNPSANATYFASTHCYNYWYKVD